MAGGPSARAGAVATLKWTPRRPGGHSDHPVRARRVAGGHKSSRTILSRRPSLKVGARSQNGYTCRSRARWGVGGALYPQSAIAGLNSLSRFGFAGLCRYEVMNPGSRTAGNCEPGQGRKAAAISSTLRVMRGFLGGAYERSQAGRFESTEGARLFSLHGKMKASGPMPDAFSVSRSSFGPACARAAMAGGRTCGGAWPRDPSAPPSRWRPPRRPAPATTAQSRSGARRWPDRSAAT